MESWLETAFALFSFAFGCVIASFLNVVICRVPKGLSIVSPPSHCPSCKTPIRWFENVPVVSWLALRGRCSRCKTPISSRYILVELLGGILFLAVFLKFGATAPLLWVWVSLMIVGFFIDAEHKVLPDFVTVGGMIYGVGLSLIFTFWKIQGSSFFFELQYFRFMPFNSLVGLVVGFSLLYLVRAAGTKVFKREAMGMGDVFLLGAIGAIFGPVATIFTIMFSSVFGAFVGLLAVAFKKNRIGDFIEIPFGPYIVLANLLWMFSGPQIVEAYLSLIKV